MNPTATKEYIPFFHEVLTSPAGSLPKGAQWIVMFEDLQGTIMPGIKTALENENQKWGIERAAMAITNPLFQKNSGCIFCQAIAVPGETLTTNAAGNIVSGAFLRSYVNEGRNQPPEMRMSFLDTNVSFADNFLRSWAISTANFGMLARSRWSEENYRTNAYCYKLGSFAHDKPPTILMKVSFIDICCTSVSEEEYSYELATSYSKREAKFIYNHYSIDTESDNDDFLNNATQTKSAPKSPAG
jgi:hypothetical protein